MRVDEAIAAASYAPHSESDLKLVTFEVPSDHGPVRRAGALTERDEVVDLNAADTSLPSDLLQLLQLGRSGLASARDALERVMKAQSIGRGPRLRYAAGTYRLLAPLPRPPSLRDFLLVEQHIRNTRKQAPPEEWFKLPVYYKGNVDSVIGPDVEVGWPRYTAKLDYELEICAVMGEETHGVDPAEAIDHIAGYTIFNDWSARDIQRREMSVGLGPALGKDFANSLGPCIVTADEFDPNRAQMRARIDGEVWSEGDLSGMRFTFAEVISWLSLEQTLYPGDLIGSGTIAGGCGLELDRWLKPGSLVELEVDGIGVLRNRVGPRPAGDLVLGPPPPLRDA